MGVTGKTGIADSGQIYEQEWMEGMDIAGTQKNN
jgi:hypothetical protein